MTYAELIKQLQQAVREDPSLATRTAAVYQTDNFVRQVDRVQWGVGGAFIGTRREWRD